MKNFVFAFLMFVLIPLTTLAAGLVDINTATSEQIQALPGVGKKTADAIVAARPFKSVEELKKVKGIGEAKFAKLKDVVSVDGSAPVVLVAAAVNSANNTAAKAANSTEKAVNNLNTAASQVANSATGSAKGGSMKAGEVVNINTASAAELDRLPGIGAVKAKAIIAARPFSSVEDLTKVKGIKQATLEKVRPYVTVK
jgi:competence ComEA-like helix-hairpin-helix protein